MKSFSIIVLVIWSLFMIVYFWGFLYMTTDGVYKVHPVKTVVYFSLWFIFIMGATLAFSYNFIYSLKAALLSIVIIWNIYLACLVFHYYVYSISGYYFSKKDIVTYFLFDALLIGGFMITTF